jgi:hypothetical protein
MLFVVMLSAVMPSVVEPFQLENLKNICFGSSYNEKVISEVKKRNPVLVLPGNTRGGSIIVPLTSCLTGLDCSVLQMKT